MTKTQKQPSKIDEKQKKHLLEAVLKEHPEIQGDSLQLHYVERMIESYLLNPNEFNRQTTELIKQEKKNPTEAHKLPEEIICISKVEAEAEQDGIKDVIISPQENEGEETQS